MHETAPTPFSPDQPPLTENAITLPPSSPPAPPQAPGRTTRLLRTLFAWPRSILRHPLRTLIIALLLLLIGAGSGVAGVWMWASYHLRSGRTALESYHTAEAVQHLQAALRVWPHDPDTLLLAARAARRAKAFDTAEHFLDLYQEQRKEDEDLTLERICLRAERGEPDSVAKYCQGLIERSDPATPLVLEALTQGYLRNYQPQKAGIAINEWLELDPDNPQALILQGQLYELLQRQADAIKSYRAALTADSTLDEARLRLSDVLMQLGSVEEAKPHLEYLGGRLPNNPKVQVYLARVQDRMGHPELAEQILDTVLAHQPNYAAALLDRGILALRAGQFDQAEKYLREAVKQDPSDHQAHDRLAFCLEQNGKLAEADKAREHIKRMEKDMDEIQAIVRGKLEQDPHNADLHYEVGMISLRAGAATEGLRWLHSALKENPSHQGAHKALMEYYQSIGDLGRAREHRQKLTK